MSSNSEANAVPLSKSVTAIEDAGSISKTNYCGNPWRNDAYLLWVTVNFSALDSVTLKLVKFVQSMLFTYDSVVNCGWQQSTSFS